MKIRDLLEVVNTDSVVLARENDILVDCETPYINQALIFLHSEEDITFYDQLQKINLVLLIKYHTMNCSKILKKKKLFLAL